MQTADPLSALPLATQAAGDAERSSTTNALLGLLSLGPATGYELRQLIEATVGNFWKESFGQIYPALGRLVAEGLAEMQAEPDGKRLPRKVYRLTGHGRQQLVAWLDKPARLQVPRNELLLKVFFGNQLGAEQTSAQIRRFHAEQQKLLMHYRGIEKALEAEHSRDARMPYWRLTVRYGRAEAEALARWAESSLAELTGME